MTEKIKSEDFIKAFGGGHMPDYHEIREGQEFYGNGYKKGYADGYEKAEKEIVYCKDCRHRDPEDKKCDCGCIERQGCIFPVGDDYFCKFGSRRYSDVIKNDG